MALRLWAIVVKDSDLLTFSLDTNTGATPSVYFTKADAQASLKTMRYKNGKSMYEVVKLVRG